MRANKYSSDLSAEAGQGVNLATEFLKQNWKWIRCIGSQASFKVAELCFLKKESNKNHSGKKV